MKTALAAAMLATGAGTAPASGAGNEFVELLQGVHANASPEELDRQAEALAAVPGAVSSYLAVASEAESAPIGPQRRLMELVAPRLPTEEVVAVVRKALGQEPDLGWRRAALELMGRHATASDLDVLIRLIPGPEAAEGEGEDEDPVLGAFRATMVEVARRDPEIFGALSSQGFVPTPVSIEIMRAIGLAGDPGGISWLAEQLDEPGLTDVALQEIGRLAPAVRLVRAAQIAEAVRPFLWSEEPSRRGHALRAMAAMGDVASVPRLIEMLDSSTGGERQTILTALSDMTGCNLPDNPAVWRGWHSEEQRWWVEESPGTLDRLWSSDDAEVVAAVRSASRHRLQRHRLAVEMARLLRRHESPTVRRQVCAALASLGSRAALEDLVRALRDQDPGVREEAQRALQSITGHSQPDDAITGQV